MKTRFIFLIVFLVIFSLVPVSGLIWSNTTFNNSLTTENLTFTGNENITRFLAIPENVIVSNGFLNLSGFLNNDKLLTNLSLRIGENEGFNITNEFGIINNSGMNNETILIELPLLDAVTLSIGIVIELKEPLFIRNVSMSFLSSDITQLKILDESGNQIKLVGLVGSNAEVNLILGKGIYRLECSRPGGGVRQVGKNTSFTFPKDYPRYVYINGSQNGVSSGGTNIFCIESITSNPINVIENNNRTNNLAFAINSFLSGCTLQNGFCLVPFLFHSDTAGILQYLDLLFSNEGFGENSQTFQTSTFDTARETFQINISFDSGRYTDTDATLVYNTTRVSATKSGTGNERIFTALKDINIVSTQQNVSFYWEIAMTDSDGQTIFNSTFNNQTVSPSNLIQCGAGSRAINYTTYDEGDQSLLVTDFDATFTWKLTEGSDVTKNVSVSLSGANNYQFCINTNQTFFTDVDINLDATGFSERTFGFNQEEFSNDTTDQRLYLLNDTLGTNVILKLKNVGLFPLADYTIKIFRKLSSGSEILIENDITDNIGQIVARLIENDVKYRFEFFDPDNKLVKTIQTSIIACTTTICQQTFIIQSLTGAFDDFDDLEDHTFGFSFDNNTRTFSFSWVDNRGESQTHRLLIEKITFSNGTEVVFNGTSTSNSDVLSFTADTSKASYRASAFRKVGSDEDRIGLINISIGNDSNIFSFEGLYWSLIFFMLLLLVGRFHPPTGIILYLFGVFMLGILGIVFINPAIMIAQIIIGVLFIWAWR